VNPAFTLALLQHSRLDLESKPASHARIACISYGRRSSAIAASSGHGGFARLMGGGVMAVGTRLMALGLGMNEIRGVARELFRFGHDKIGADQMGEIILGRPGLSQFA
jgi:hypothetical protein